MPFFCLIVQPLLEILKNDNIGLKINYSGSNNNNFNEYVGCQAYVDDIVLICEFD